MEHVVSLDAARRKRDAEILRLAELGEFPDFKPQALAISKQFGISDHTALAAVMELVCRIPGATPTIDPESHANIVAENMTTIVAAARKILAAGRLHFNEAPMLAVLQVNGVSRAVTILNALSTLAGTFMRVPALKVHTAMLSTLMFELGYFWADYDGDGRDHLFIDDVERFQAFVFVTLRVTGWMFSLREIHDLVEETRDRLWNCEDFDEHPDCWKDSDGLPHYNDVAFETVEYMEWSEFSRIFDDQSGIQTGMDS